MLHYVCHDIFESPAQTLVNTVNTVGVMGKGLAREFKRRYPSMFERYREFCRSGDLEVGKLYLFRSPNKWVLNFPTKQHWRSPSQLEWIEAGLQKFAAEYETRGINSVSFPQLGCGNGGLDWATVKPLMHSYLAPLPIPVFVHTRIADPRFIPEHEPGGRAPDVDPQLVNTPPERIDFDRFLADFMSLFGGERLAPRDPPSIDALEPPPLPEVSIHEQGQTLQVSGESLQVVWDKLVSVGAVPSHRLPGLEPHTSTLVARHLNRLDYIEPISFVMGSFDEPRIEPGIRYSPRPSSEVALPALFMPRAVEQTSS